MDFERLIIFLLIIKYQAKIFLKCIVLIFRFVNFIIGVIKFFFFLFVLIFILKSVYFTKKILTKQILNLYTI